MFNGCPKRYYHLRVAKDIKEQDGDASLDGQIKHKSLEDRIKHNEPLPPYLTKYEGACRVILDSGLHVEAEQELAVTKELQPCEWWHRDAWLRVKADVALYGKTKSAILDWKMGKRRPKPFQLELGALLQYLHYPHLKSTEAAFLWAKDDVSDRSVFTREDDYERILDKVKAKTERIEEAVAEDVWPAKPGYHCNWCGAKDTCVYSQARS